MPSFTEFDPNHEAIEAVRQQIMRFRELLDLMQLKLQGGEQAYSGLFAAFTAEEIASSKEKDLQWKLAERLVGSTEPLERAVGHMRFEARELERAFEELHGIVVSSGFED